MKEAFFYFRNPISEIEIMEAGMIDKIEDAEKAKLKATTLVVCDAGGRVLAVSSRAAADGLFGAGTAQIHFAEIFGPDSKITRWLTEHLSEARKQGDYYAESSLESDELKLFACIETLMKEGEIFGTGAVRCGTPPTLPGYRCVARTRQAEPH